MATGIVKGEQIGSNAITADMFTEEPFPLPGESARLALTYPNKVSEAEILAPIKHSFLSIDSRGVSRDTEKISANAFLLADNFFALSQLLQQTHTGNISLIYLDPPFGTGLNFHSRKLDHAYVDQFGPATYTEFMRRRLVLMRELLSTDGSIYLHIGHQMLFHVKLVMDEVFGPSNFRNLIVRRKCSSKNYTKNQYPNLNDYILFYSKSKNYKWNTPSVAADQDWVHKEYPKLDARGRYKLVPVHAPGTRNGETGKEWRGMLPPPGKHWQYTPEKLEEFDRNGEMHWSKNGNPRRKVYLSFDKQRVLTDYWDGYRDAHHQSIAITGYPTEKNLELLKVIVCAGSDKGDLVMDPFAGSGTTLHAATELERRWLGIDQSLTSAQAVIKRLRHGLSPMGDYVRREQAPVIDLFGSETVSIAAPPKNNGIASQTPPFSFIVDKKMYEAHKNEITKIASS